MIKNKRQVQISSALKSRLLQRALAVLDADSETEGFTNDIESILQCEDVPVEIMQAAQTYYLMLSKRMNR